MKMDMETLKEYYPHILIAIGIIPILLHASAAFKKYAILNTINKAATIVDKIFFQETFNSLITNFVVNSFGVLVTAIIGFAVALALIIYLVRVIQNPTKNDFIIIAILGIVAILLNSVIGGIVIIIGGVVGMNRLQNTKRKKR